MTLRILFLKEPVNFKTMNTPPEMKKIGREDYWKSILNPLQFKSREWMASNKHENSDYNEGFDEARVEHFQKDPDFFNTALQY